MSLTCDGPSCHLAMINELGGSMNVNNFKPYFCHPSDSSKLIYVLLDVCHMLKLLRNTLGDYGILKDADGNEIKWQYIERLQKLQGSEGIR